MSARLIILVVIAGVLAVYFAAPKSKPAVIDEDQTVLSDESTGNLEMIRLKQILLADRPLQGSEPSVPSEVAASVDVDPSTKKNRLVFTLSESHGYYMEAFELLFWYKPTPDVESSDSPLTSTLYVNDYIKANATLRTCTEIVPSELARIGGHLGTAENWGVRVKTHGRAREKNPDPLPPLGDVARCRD
ncbi:MAG: hypothetical protein AABZ12_04850 [Planctomycetota bacterium]